MNNNNENEINQIQEESKEGMEVARGTPCNSNADSSAVRGQGENQLIARSEDDGALPVEDSSTDMDDSAASSMGSNDTYGSVAALFSYEARKQGMATTLKAPGKYASLWLPRTVEAAYGQQEGGSTNGSECRYGPAHRLATTLRCRSEQGLFRTQSMLDKSAC